MKIYKNRRSTVEPKIVRFKGDKVYISANIHKVLESFDSGFGWRKAVPMYQYDLTVYSNNEYFSRLQEHIESSYETFFKSLGYDLL